jgi:hypothetical protein
MLGISLYSYPYLKYQKHAIFLIIAYVFFSTKLEKEAEKFLPGSGRWGVGGRGKGVWRERAGCGALGRNGPNNVCTCTCMNK